ncbi:MAG: ExeM/NucH family extracellular endonuclease [Cyanobacteriota bacterium]
MQPWFQAALRRAGQLMVALVFGLVLLVSLKGCGSGGGSPLSVLPEQTTSTTSSVIEALTTGEEGFSPVASAPSYLTLSGTAYSENFDGIGAGLPAGWTVRTGATATNLGAEQPFTATVTSWADTAGRFKNFASGDGSLGAAATATEQNAATDRALGIRQTGAFGDPGAAFVFEIDDTAGLENFNLSLKAQMLSVQPRSTTWTVDYRVGESGTFTPLGTYSDPGEFGSTTLATGSGLNAFGADINNQCDPVYIRIVALSASTGSGSRDSFGIDDVELTYSTASPPAVCGGDPTPTPSPSPTPTPPTPVNLPLSEGFDSCSPAPTGWQIVDVDGDTTRSWRCTNSLAEANNFGGQLPANDWLITPPLNLGSVTDPALTFRNESFFSDNGLPFPQLSVLYSTDYSGAGTPAAVNAATWISLTIPTVSTGSFVDSGEIDLSGIPTANPVYVAFRYRSSGTGSGTTTRWRIDSVNFAQGSGGGQPGGGCDPNATITPIGTLQGNGFASPIVGQTRTISGIVVGDFENEGVAGQTYLQGYYVQDAGDGDPATSDGIFIFSSTANTVSLGDEVQVTGTVAEFRQQTQLTNVFNNFAICSSGNPLPAPVQIRLPLTPDEREALEGMLVTFGDQPLFVTDSFLLGRHGELSVASGGRLFNPTQIADPGQAPTLQAQNDLNRIRIDDQLLTQNPDPVIYPAPNGLSASNTVRGGDRVSNITGVMTQLRGRNAGGTQEALDATIDYRIHPNDPNVLPTFTTTNPRPQTPPAVGGSLKVASFNVLNYFNTFGSGNCFPIPSDCRGASNATEFTRQRDKIINAIRRIDADILGLIELENDGYGPSSAIQDLVNGLNAQPGAPYAFVDVGVPNLGGDAITNGFIYKPSSVEIVPGTTAAFLDTGELTQGPGRRHRPPLAVTFRQLSNNATFTAVVNHLKSKGSPCDPADNDPFQGNCNGNRTRAAEEILTWLTTNPTGSTDPDVLIMGDINAYAMEDPIKTLERGGFINLNGSNSYSFSFQGQWGSLDHALANGSLNSQVSGSDKWHINADEPVILDYGLSFKSASQQSLFYSDDPFRSSDHDPVIVGLNLTGSGPTEPVAPVVVSTLPVNGATGVPRDTQIRLTFDQPIQKGTGTIVLRRRVLPILDTRTTDIATSPRVAIDGNTFILTVSGRGTPLNRLTLYDFTFPAGGVTSLSGVPLANPVSFSFRTRLD